MVNSSSTLLMSRVALGRALRRLRDEVHDMTIVEVAERLGCDNSVISRIETGKRPCSQEHFAKLMDLYGLSEEQREELAELHVASRERRPPWWTKYNEVIVTSYERYLAFEDAADTVYEYQLGLVPGLLQTEQYARAVTAVGFASLGPDQVDGLVEVRMVRQRKRLYEADTPLNCYYVITQAALDFHVGGHEVRRRQLQHLLDASERDGLELQVIPYEKGEDGCQLANFTIFEFPGDVPDVGFSDSVAGSLPMDDPRDLRRLHRLYRSLAGAALSPRESRDLIARIKDRED
jgi:transcriptional regulator with XRE-family HTH domain